MSKGMAVAIFKDIYTQVATEEEKMESRFYKCPQIPDGLHGNLFRIRISRKKITKQAFGEMRYEYKNKTGN